MLYAFDTNTIIYLLNGDKAVIERRNEAIAAGARFCIPPVVDYEIRRGLLYKPSPKKEGMYWAIVSRYGIGDMTAQAWARAAGIYADLRRKSLTIGDADILIAAFCIVNEYALITNNTRHFESIDGLQLVNWVE